MIDKLPRQECMLVVTITNLLSQNDITGSMKFDFVADEWDCSVEETPFKGKNLSFVSFYMKEAIGKITAEKELRELSDGEFERLLNIYTELLMKPRPDPITVGTKVNFTLDLKGSTLYIGQFSESEILDNADKIRDYVKACIIIRRTRGESAEDDSLCMNFSDSLSTHRVRLHSWAMVKPTLDRTFEGFKDIRYGIQALKIIP